MPMNRRTFLLTGAGAAVLLGCRDGSSARPVGADTGAGPPPSTAAPTTTIGSTTTVTPTTRPATGGDGTLVLVTLYGGNDALNTVVPFGDSRYAAARGALAVDPAAAHDLGDGWALHPALRGTKALWDDQRLAVIHGVGFAGLDRSHFHCMDVWQAGREDDVATGWLGRWLDAVGGDPLEAMAVGRRLPLALRGAVRSAAVVPVGPFELPGDDRLRRLLTELAGADEARAPLAAMAASSTADLLAVVDTVGPLMSSLGLGDDAGDEAGVGGTAASETGGLGAQLDVVAGLIEAGLPTRAYGVELGGFDTHANQAGVHEALLTELDGALSGFVQRMGARPVTVVVYSEFGRRVQANGSAGTDHGGAGTVLLAGNARAGFHGEPSPLDRLVDGDLATTVDFRSVYGGLLEGVLGFPADDVLPGAPPPLALI